MISLQKIHTCSEKTKYILIISNNDDPAKDKENYREYKDLEFCLFLINSRI